MSDSCRAFRDDWLEAAPSGDEAGASVARHRAQCAACDAWCARLAGQLRALSDLAPLAAPSILAAAAANEIEPGSEARFARLFGGLEPLAAPAVLEERLANESFYSAFLGRLSAQRAPQVLERLVAEELADPAARARRFAESLERRAAPSPLTERLQEWRRAPANRRRLAPLAATLAAALLLWIGLRETRTPSESRYAFRVRYADVSSLDPLAAQLGQALGGAVGLAVDPVPAGRADGTGNGAEDVR